MIQTDKNVFNKVLVLAVLFVVVCCIVFTYPTSNSTNSDVAFAAVGDSATIYYYAEPIGADQRCTWTLEYDKDKTSGIVYSSVSRYETSRFVTMETTDNSCTLTCVKYATFAITYKFYLILTATCVENPELTATCSICVGG